MYDALIPVLASTSLKGKKVLDAGCGTGDLSFWMSARGAKVTGVDVSRKAVGIARKRVKGGRFAVSDILDAKGAYDAVMCIGVLHHNKNPAEVFSHLAGLTKKGGRIVVGVYYRYGRTMHRLKRLLVRALAGEDTGKRMETAYKLFFRDFWKIRNRVPKLAGQVDVMVADQFANPIESSHSKGEVRKWFSNAGVRVDKIFIRRGFLWASGTKE